MRMGDIAGRTIGSLLVLEIHEEKSRCGKQHWICECDCGNKRVVSRSNLARFLRGGYGTISCRECAGAVRRASVTTHNLSYSQEHKAWDYMKRRCYYVKFDKYDRYGGRGIVVCDRWVNSFEAFYADMGPKPSPRHSLDRIDNDGPYSPNNCRWATPHEQATNTCRTRYIEYNGVRKRVAEWAEDVGVTYNYMLQRLKRMSIEDAVTTPSRNHACRSN
jgi:hypothetical protein